MRCLRFFVPLCICVTLLPNLTPLHAAAKKARMNPSKRVGQGQIQPTIDGKAEETVKRCEKFLQDDPKHLESLFNLAVAWGRLKDTEKAMACVRRAVEAGLPFERFLAGPRNLLQPLTDTPEFKQFAAKHPVELLHGPMLGCVTDRSAKFWVRTAHEMPVQVVLSQSDKLAMPIKSATVFTDEKRDYTAVAEVERLEPNTTYYYDVLLGGKPTLGPKFPSFRTFPPAGSKAKFKIAFGGGAGYTPMHERMWDVLASHHLLSFLFLGDNVYIDNPTRPDMQRYTYYRRQSRPEYRRFIASVPLWAIWDDHDFATNDCVPGADKNDPPWKVPVWNLYKNNWNNPAYGGGEKNPGCWFSFSIADVDFFMLDGRYYRANPGKQNATMLGPVQKKWLYDELKRSWSAFRVLASLVPWVLEAKGTSRDTWRGFEAEREEIFTFLEKNKINGVILLSSDRHRSDVWRIDRPGGYPLFEFESSRLTNIHTHGPQPGCLFSYNAKCSFGQLDFDTAQDDPQVTYRIFNIDDELIHTFSLKKSQLTGKQDK